MPTPTKRARALERIAERDPERAERLGSLRRLLPPRRAGRRALVEGAPHADVVLAWHTGFDGLDSFGGIVAKLAKPLPPVRFVVRRVPRGRGAGRRGVPRAGSTTSGSGWTPRSTPP